MRRAFAAVLAMMLLVPVGVAAQDETWRGHPDVPVAEPRDDLVRLRQSPWQRIEIHPDGRTLDVYFWSGVPECFGLDRIEVSPTDTGLDVKVFTGDIAQPDVDVCILPALLYVTTVDLDEPLISGGRDD